MSLTNKALLVLSLALFVVGASWLGWLENNARLEAELEALDRRFQAMSEEHAAAIRAASEAARARDEIILMYGQKASELEASLAACPGFSDLVIPYDVLMRLSNQCGNTDSASPSQPARSD